MFLLTERGTSFGYNNLVVDIRSFPILRSFGYPVIFDVTHSLQLPGGQGSCSGGQREFAGPLARAAVAAGVDGLFMEVHPEPGKALCDGPNMIQLDDMKQFLKVVKSIHELVSAKVWIQKESKMKSRLYFLFSIFFVNSICCRCRQWGGKICAGTTASFYQPGHRKIQRPF